MDRLISEQAVLDTVFECVDAYDSREVKESLNMYIQSHIKAIPSAEPKTGYWIEDEYEMEVRCSVCGEENDECSKYCPTCGVRMIEPQEGGK